MNHNGSYACSHGCRPAAQRSSRDAKQRLLLLDRFQQHWLSSTRSHLWHGGAQRVPEEVTQSVR